MVEVVKDCKLSKTEAGTKECKLIVDEERKGIGDVFLSIYSAGYSFR